MRVSRHAQHRFALRIDAQYTDPRWIILDAWHDARPATSDDLSLYGIVPMDGYSYRVGRLPMRPYFLLVEANDCIVTIIDNH